MYKPTLNLIANPNITPTNLTVTRASSATRINSNGIMEYVAPNTLRHDYDPLTGEYLGWLVEEGRQNQLTYSEKISSGWTNSNLSYSNGIIAPDGITTCLKLQENSSSSVEFSTYSNQFSFSPGFPLTFSCFVKTFERTEIQLQIVNMGLTSGFQANFNLGNLTTNNVSSIGPLLPVSAKITPYKNNWYRIQITSTTNTLESSCFGGIKILKSNQSNYVGTIGYGLYVWGAQIEYGADASSYIGNCNGTGLTRQSDQFNVPTSAFNFNPSQGTLYTEFTSFFPYSNIASLNDGTINNKIELFVDNYGLANTQMVSGGASQFSFTSQSITGVSNKMAVSWQGNDFGYVVNGGNTQVDTASRLIPTVTQLSLGYTPSSTYYCRKYIKQVFYFTDKLDSLTLQNVTRLGFTTALNTGNSFKTLGISGGTSYTSVVPNDTFTFSPSGNISLSLSGNNLTIGSSIPVAPGNTTTFLRGDNTWATPASDSTKLSLSTVTTSGDLIVGTGASTVTRLPIGTNTQVLTVSGGNVTWATPAAGGGTLTQADAIALIIALA